MKIALAGTGYVGLSIATLFARHHEVVALDINAAKGDQINRRQSTIEDINSQRFLHEEPLNLCATFELCDAYEGADFVVIATPTDYASDTNHSARAEAIIQRCDAECPQAVIVIKSAQLPSPGGTTQR